MYIHIYIYTSHIDTCECTVLHSALEMHIFRNHVQNVRFTSEAEVSQCAFVLTTVGEELGKVFSGYLT